MSTRTGTIAALATVLALGAFTGCGSDDVDNNASGPAKGATSTGGAASAAPSGPLTASAAPPRLGYYAGVECAGPKATCDAIQNGARAGYQAYCRGGVPHDELASYFTFEGREYNFVCFTLKTANNLRNFSFAGVKIVRSIHVSADRFPETCDNGSCIKGEWWSTRKLSGTIRNPNGVRARYRAEWIARR